MQSACQYGPNMATTIFNHEILNIPQSLCTNNISMYHGAKSDILKKFSRNCNSQVPLYAIIIEMTPVIRAKCSNFGDISCFSDLATLLFHHIENLGSTFARVDLIFEGFSEDSLKEATQDKRGQGSRFFFDGDTPLPKTLGNDFLLNSQNKNDFNEFLAQKFIQLHNTPNILIVFFYSFSGCDTTSSFFKRGKCKIWDTLHIQQTRMK